MNQSELEKAAATLFGRKMPRLTGAGARRAYVRLQQETEALAKVHAGVPKGGNSRQVQRALASKAAKRQARRDASSAQLEQLRAMRLAAARGAAGLQARA
ncbi:MAG: hypothetical protein ACXU82_03915 [Caulobacteraceae bacterium]